MVQENELLFMPPNANSRQATTQEKPKLSEDAHDSDLKDAGPSSIVLQQLAAAL